MHKDFLLPLVILVLAVSPIQAEDQVPEDIPVVQDQSSAPINGDQPVVSNADSEAPKSNALEGDGDEQILPIRAQLKDGFARLLVRAERGETVEAEVKNGILLVQFESPKSIDLRQIKREIPEYIALARHDSDKMKYRFALKQDYRMQQSRGLADIAIDLVPDEYKGMPDKLRIVIDKEIDQSEQTKILEEEIGPVTFEFVDVRVSEHEDFSRVSFDWPESVDYTASLENGIVSVNFSAIGDPDLSRLRIDPPKYIRSADKNVQADGTLVRIKLARRANMRHHREGPSVIIDVYERDGVSHFTDADAIVERLGLPEGVANTSEMGVAKTSDTNNSQHDTHSQTDVGTLHKEKRDDGPGKLQVETNENLDAHPTGEHGDTLKEEHVDQGYSEHGAHDVVKDSNMVHEEPADDAEHSATGLNGHRDAHRGDVAESEKHTSSKADEAHGPVESEGHSSKLLNASVQEDAWNEVAEVLEAIEHHPADDTKNGDEQEFTPAVDNSRADEIAEVSKPEGKSHEQNSEDEGNENSESFESHPSSGDLFEVQGYDDGKSYSLIFEWDKSVPAAVFQREDVLWIVFDDNGQAFDLSSLGSGYGKYIVQASQTQLGSARIVQVSLVRDLLVSVTHEAHTWKVSLEESADSLPRFIEFKNAYLDDGRAVIRAELNDHAHIHDINDPESGENLIIATAFASPRGVISERNYVEFDVLASAHGLVVRPLADRIYVRGNGKEIEIGSGKQEGLILTRLEKDGGDTYAFDISSDPGRIDLDNWQGGAVEDFTEIDQQLQTSAVMTPDLEAIAGLGRGQAAQVRFYLAHGLAHEALGILKQMRRQNEDVEVDPSYLALRGVAQYMAGRYPMALEDLSYSRLEDDPDAKLWKAATLRRLGRYGEARQLFQETNSVWGHYPVHWQIQFHLAAADAALATKDIKGVEEHLKRIPEAEATPLEMIEAKLLTARMYEAYEEPANALQFYQLVIDSRLDPFATLAEFYQVGLKRRLNQMTPDEAAAVLSRLQFTWRGDDLEFEILHELGILHLERGDYRLGLTTLRDVLEGLENSEIADAISTTLSDTFNDLFLKGTADKLPPTKALGLYYEFRELTPIGRDGDDMIRKLADRLISVDLLAQAAELLDHQVRNRLSGIARAQVATRLALVYLMDQKADKALQILRTTRQTGLPGSLSQDRRLVEARALTELKRFDHALELINGYYGIDFERLRSDIYWENQDWQKTAQKLEELVERSYVMGRPMTDRQRSDLLRSAVAYSLAEDQPSLNQLKTTYGNIMAVSPDAEAFALMTSPNSDQDVDFRRLASQIAGVDTLDTFMMEMSERFDIGGAGS